MENFLTHIHINKIFHLENIDIPIDEKEMKHLIITGKNGSGKTSVLNVLVEILQIISNKKNPYFIKLEREIAKEKKGLISLNHIENDPLINSYYGASSQSTINYTKNRIKSLEESLEKAYGGIHPFFKKETQSILKEVQENNLLFAFYAAHHKIEVKIPQTLTKPDLSQSGNIRSSKNTEFLYFLADLKAQEAFATTNSAPEDATNIKKWFDNFEDLLKDIFNDQTLKLEFEYKNNYSFFINKNGNRFGFNQLSDGYSAIIDIVSDLILKMQTPDSLTRFYEKEGIVLIDEIETHLHLELQRLILPFLTRIFPNIQFIVTTHSPFVINSIPNAVVFDLERKIRLENLTEYSYEALAEGYFKINTDSTYLQNKLVRFKELAQKTDRDNAETFEYKKLDEEFASLNEAIAPLYVKNEYFKTKLTAKP